MPKMSKKTLIILQVVLVIFVIIIAFIVNKSSKGGKNLLNGTTRTTPADQTPNPLIDQQDQKKVEEDYQNKTGTKPKKYKFNFQLAPELKDKASFIDKLDVNALTICNLLDAPTSLPVYTLKARIDLSGATVIANKFDLGKYPASSIPREGGTFDYYFSDPEAKSYLSLTEASVFYHYHKAINDALGKQISLLDAQKISQNELARLGLNTGLTISTSSKLVDNLYILDYRKPLSNNLKLIDPVGVKTYVGSTICSINQTDSVSAITVTMRTDGKITNVYKNTRDVLAVKTLARQSLEKSLENFRDNPIAVIANPENKSTPETGDITIDEVVLSYYDMGALYAQVSYLPVYIAGGVVKGHPETKGYIVIPAVSEATLKAEGFLTAEGAGKKTYASSQKLETFEELAPPKSVDACFDGFVDYTLSCSINGTTICGGIIGLDKKDDPLNVCKDGCKYSTEVIDVTGKSDEKSACLQVLDKKGIKYDEKAVSSQLKNYIKINGTSGRATCSFQACPC